MSTENPKEEMEESIYAELEDADYPLNSQMDALGALSDGMSTEFEAGDKSMTVMEFATTVDLDFPYESVDELVDDSMDKLEDIGFFEDED